MESDKYPQAFPLANLVPVPSSLQSVPVTTAVKEDVESGSNRDDAMKYTAYDLGYMDRGRRPKFSVAELEALVSGVESHKDVILPPNGMGSYQGSLSSSQTRQNCWKDILGTVNTVSEVKRSLPEVVKRWRYLKSRTRVKARRLTKWDKPLTPLQKRILDTVGDLDDSPNGGDGESNDHYDEDGWDEYYEVDIGDVEEGANNDDVTNVEEYNNSQLLPSRKVDTRPQAQQVAGNAYVMDQEVININPKAASHPSQKVIYVSTDSRGEMNTNHQHEVRPAATNTPPARHTPRNNFVSNHSHRVPSTTIERRSPSIQERHAPTINDRYGGVVQKSVNTEKVADNSNVNINVQSCSCHGPGDHGRNINEERLEIERRRLELERQRLEIEKQRLHVERERLELEKKKSVS